MKGYRITRDKFMAKAEAKRLLDSCRVLAKRQQKQGRRIWVQRYMLTHIALSSGLRVSEIAGLKVGDLFLGDKESYLVVRKGKGGKKRDVYLDKRLAAHLKDYLRLKENTWEEPTDPGSPFFAGRGGGHYTTTALHISFKKVLALLGLDKGYSIHSARHTYATMLLAKTNNLRFVQKQLGHASLSMTAQYADVLPELNQALANALLD